MTCRIKVLNYNPLFRPFLGGVEQNIFTFARYSKHEHMVFTDLLPGTSRFEKDNGVSIFRIGPSRREISIRLEPCEMVLDLLREANKSVNLNKIDFDIMHLRASYTMPRLFQFLDEKLGYNIFIKISAWRLCKKPMVVTFHTLPSRAFPFKKEFFYNPFPPLHKRLFWIEIEKYYCRRAECIICVDRYMINPLRKLSKGKKVIYVPSAIDVKIFRPIRKEEALKCLRSRIREKIEKDETFHLLYLGRIDLDKGAHCLHALANRLPNSSKLVVVGHGNVKLLKENERMIYVGRVQNEELPYLINYCDVVFNPTLVNGTGRVTFESMACGKPVIMFEGERYPLLHGENGFLVKDLNGVLSIVKELQRNSSLYETISKNAIETAQRYSVQNMVKKVDRIYEEIYGKACAHSYVAL